MKKILVGAVAAFAVILMGCGSVYAALQCTSQPSCASLGYTTSDIEGCDNYVYCPFDTTYKACVGEQQGECDADCILDACPSNANCTECGNSKFKITSCRYTTKLTPDKRACIESCSSYSGAKIAECPDLAECDECTDGENVYYVINDCLTGYTISNNTCVIDRCSGYPFSQCLTGYSCTKCQSGASPYVLSVSYKYKPSGTLPACGQGEYKYYADEGYDRCPYGMTCGYCQANGWIALYIKSCPDGSYAGNYSSLECERDCPTNMSGYYVAKDAPLNKKIESTCEFYHNVSGSDYTLYYKTGSESCTSSYDINEADCFFGAKNTCEQFDTAGKITTYTDKCNGTDNQSSDGCKGGTGDWITISSAAYSSARPYGSAGCYVGDGYTFQKYRTCVYNGVTYYHDC